MKPTLLLVVHGTPAPQGSKRYLGNGRMVEASQRVAPWREAVRHEVQKAMAGQPPLTGPVSLNVAFYLPRARSHFGPKGLRPGAPRWPISRRGDLDKYVRAIGDALTQGGAYLDDSQIVSIVAVKRYVDDAHPTASALITVTAIQTLMSVKEL